MDDLKERRLELFGLLAVLALALCLRLQHLETLLPWFIFEDELRLPDVSLHLIANYTLDPGHNLYPALAFYLNTIAFTLWAAIGLLGEILGQGPRVISEYFSRWSPADPVMILLSRWVSLAFGMGSLVFTHLLARLYLPWRWALLATLLMAVNSMHISMSVLAKVDAINLFWFTAGYYAGSRYFLRGGLAWLAAASVCAGFTVVTKSNYMLILILLIVLFIRKLGEQKGLVSLIKSMFAALGRFLKSLIRLRRLLPAVKSPDLEIPIALALIAAAAFIGSPYTFIRFKDTLVNVGWLYLSAEIISTYHTDPHVWWRDRYFYLISIVLPFVFGLPMFWAAVAGTIHHLRKNALKAPFISFLIIFYVYIYASQSGGPMGGAFAYYLFLVTVPLAIFVTVEWLHDLACSANKNLRVFGLILTIILFTVSLARVNSFHNMFYAEYDRLGPWLASELKPNERALIISVYKPGPALDQQDIFYSWPGRGLGAGASLIFDDPRDRVFSVWPHSLKIGEHDLFELFDPDYVVVDTWLMGGFKKFYRHHWAAPLVESLTAERGYQEVKRFPARYFGRAYFAAIDPEHEVDLIVLKKKRAPDE